MTPEPTDKLDAATTVAVNGPEDDPLHSRMDRTASRHRTSRACSSRMPGDWHVRFLGGPGPAMGLAYPSVATAPLGSAGGTPSASKRH